MLAILLGAFCLRVMAQFLQWLSPTSLLPPFSAWHSATLPYVWLLASQLLIIVGAGAVIGRIWNGTYKRRRRAGVLLLVAGTIYFGLMCLRFVLGLTVLPAHTWFGATLPAIFHMILGGFLLTLCWYELSNERHG